MIIRKAIKDDAEKIAYVHVKSWQTTYEGMLPQKVLDNLSYDGRTKQWSYNIENGNVYIAEDPEGEIVGFSTGGRERTETYPGFTGELYAIYILKEYQQQGIGKKLLKPVVDDLSATGLNSMLVWVLEQNPAEQFYERMGAKPFDKKDIEIAGNTYQEIAYVWDELPKIE